MEATGISEETFKTNFIQFFKPKTRILNKESRDKQLLLNDVISLNTEFSSNSIRINFTPRKRARPAPEAQSDNFQITQERKQVLDAVIVRIMKSRRTVFHRELIAEVMRQVQNFRPQPPLIKAQIEGLIEREYLERDKVNSSVYIYLP